MLSNNTFLKLEFNGYLMVKFLPKKGLGVHVKRMLKISGVYTLAEFFSKIFVKKPKENWVPYLRSRFDKLTIWCQLNFYLNMLCDHCLHDLHLYIWNMLTNREMVNFQKRDPSRFSLYFYYKLCYYQGWSTHTRTYSSTFFST